MSFLASFGGEKSFPRRGNCRLLRAGCVIGLFLLIPILAPSQELRAPEAQIKAAFLYNFTKYVEWPTNQIPRPESPWVIGVLGKDPFGSELDDLVKDRLVLGREVVAARFSSVSAIKDCHILFISESERRNLDSILDTLRDRPILTVSDMPGFQARGMIALVRQQDTLGLRFNLDAVKAAKLEISSRLLRLDPTLKPADDRGTNAVPARPRQQ